MTSNEIADWLTDYVAVRTGLVKTEILPTQPLAELGLDSEGLVGLTADLSDWLERDVDPAIAYDYPTIGALSACLSDSLEGPASSVGGDV